ncbi:MAG: T9SS type A sorting domain-containing protein [Bacteroidales bacterium]
MLIILTDYNCFAQTWPNVYNFFPGSYGWDIEECYDRSYIITGDVLNNSVAIMGLIFKVDVNGNVLWYRVFDDGLGKTSIYNSFLTFDDGIISTGVTKKYDSSGDIIVIKNDYCGNMDWCKIFSVPNDVEVGQSIIQTTNGNYLLLVGYYGYDIVHERIWLFNLDPSGNTIWQKLYCQNDPKIMSPIANQLIADTDSSFLITCFTYYEDTLVPNLYWPEPLIIKVDQDGNELWAKPWTYNTNDFIGYAAQSLKGSYDTYYSCGVRYNTGLNEIIAPSILKTSMSGLPLAHYELLDHPTEVGIATTIIQVSDTVLITSYRYTGPDQVDHIMLAKIDTLGNILHEKELSQYMDGASQSIITHDQKILVIAGHYINGWKMYLYKLTMDLEYDSIDNHIYNYDSLCPNPVYADTIDLDCDVIVDVQQPMVQPEKSILTIFPNPALDLITVSLPPYYTSTDQSGSYTVHTTWYTYPDDLYLEVYDINGKMTEFLKMAARQKSITIPVNQYNPGMYIIRLMSDGKQLTQGKFIKE